MELSNNFIRVSKSVVGQREADALSRVIIKDGYLGMGKEVQAFERELQQFFDTERSVICVNSGTAALHLAVAACVPPSAEVLVQSLTFVASYQAITAAGAVPVACEVHPETATIDLKDAEKKISKKTVAIMPVHYASDPGDLDAIYRFAEMYGLRVIEDAAHSFGCYHKNKRIGSFGDVVCFSFDGIKNITSGEGGAIVTADPRVSQYVQDARLLGVQKDTDKRFDGGRSWEFDITHQGYRYHMSNLFAAVGREQLKRFSEFKDTRQKLAKLYTDKLKKQKGLKLFKKDYEQTVPHIYPVRVLNGKRNELRQHLLDSKIECGIHYYPNHLLTFYGAMKGKLPVTEQLYSELLTLPLHPDLTEENVKCVIKEIHSHFAGS